MYDIDSGRWDRCQSMPSLFKDSATSTWISTATIDRKLYLLEKRSCLICSFDAKTKTWGDTFNLNLQISNPNKINPPMVVAVVVTHSIIGFVDDRLVLVGLMGEPEDLHGLGLWEVDHDSYECRPIGEMPLEMVEKMGNGNSSLSTMRASVEDGSIYIYDPWNPEQIFFCELKEGICQWGYRVNSMANEGNRMQRFVFTCSRVGMDDLHKAVATGSRTFAVSD
ncbi:F-box/kelch-repeat protein At1g23390-like [Telopea speciosissima]|uniref:F-box/kelch-repeat protein At1g23390-like n=1 Tax=Telopea speciosissima TaxID=54955 RepID=UPI001CC44D12|nr:F-box/kelch-repeat protein At1g23390-like [Telopea speciosissima]